MRTGTLVPLWYNISLRKVLLLVPSATENVDRDICVYKHPIVICLQHP
jgi:hypothetical protein